MSGILSKDEAAASRTQLWDFMERQHPQLKRDDPRTWDDHWPQLKHLGILGNDVCLSPQFCENRQNERLHRCVMRSQRWPRQRIALDSVAMHAARLGCACRAFSAVLGTKRLLVNVGRASAMRPTKSVAWGDAVVDKPEWKTLTGWVHWDMNPWTGETTAFSYESRDFRKNRGYTADKVQGVLTLVDCGPRDGGFHCVPGFHRHIRGWACHNRANFNPHAHGTTIQVRWGLGSGACRGYCLSYTGYINGQVPEEDPMKADAQPVPARAGCIIIWSSALPHGTFPNDSDRGRMVQYIKMARCDDDSLGPVFVDEELLPPSFQLTPLGRQLYGFDEWPADPDERPWSTLPTAGSDGAGGGAGAGAGAGAGDHSGTSRPP